MVLFPRLTTCEYSRHCIFCLNDSYTPELHRPPPPDCQLFVGGAPYTWWLVWAAASSQPHPPDPPRHRLGSAQPSSARPDPPGSAQLCLPHEVAGQLLPQLDAAPQRRLTEGTVQQDLVRLADSKIVAEEAEMLFGVFLPRDLHAWLPSTKTTKLQQTPSARPATGDTHFPRIWSSLCPGSKRPRHPRLPASYHHPQASARLSHGARALRGALWGAELAPAQEDHWVCECVRGCTCPVVGRSKNLHADISALEGKHL